jgi:hypothetical protein
MHTVRVRDLRICIFVLDAEQELPVASKTQRLRDAGIGAVGSDEILCRAELTQIESPVFASHMDERRATSNARPCVLGLCRQPAHDAGRVGRKKVIARRRQIHVPQIGRIEPHAAHAVHELDGKTVQQRNLVDRVPDDDPRGMGLLSDVGFFSSTTTRSPCLRQCGRASQAGETRADYDAIPVGTRGMDLHSRMNVEG